MIRTFIRTALLFAFLLTSFHAWGQILDPVEWTFYAEKNSDDEYTFVAKANIENKWHLYSQDLPEGGPIPTSFVFEESSQFQLIGDMEEISKVETVYDESFEMDLKMFSHEAIFEQRIRILSEGDINLLGSVEYMCCDDERCLPPTEEDFNVPITGRIHQTGGGTGIEKAETEIAIGSGETVEPAAGSEYVEIENPSSEETGSRSSGERTILSADAAESENSSLWIFFLVAFVAGLAGILTPCVFPMIPMTVSFFMQGSENRGRAIVKGLIFGISIIAIYTAIGVVVSISSAGAEMTNSLSTHWVPNLIFFVLFMIFAASFLGMFELVLPNKWVSSADRQADKGGFLGAFFMAFTLVLVSFSCTGPIVGALLVEAAGGLALKPILGMFGFGLAFALPFTLFAIFPSWLKGLPKSGGWLNSIKVVLGFVVLAFGMKFLSTIDQTYHLGIMSREVYLSIWIVIFVMLGFYLLGKLKFAHDSDLPNISVPRLILAIAAFSFSIYMVPGIFGANLNSISALIPPKSSQEFDLLSYGDSRVSNQQAEEHGGVNGLASAKYSDFLHLLYGLQGFFDYEEGLAYAREKNLPVLLDFKGHACSNCKEMEGKVWSDPGVLNGLRKFVIIALYTDDRTKLPEDEWITSDFDGKLKKTLGKKNMDLQITKYNTNTQPLYVIVDPDGETLSEPRGHNLDIQAFKGWLDNGLRKFGE